MARSLFGRTSYITHSLFTLAVLAMIFGLLVKAQIRAKADERYNVKGVDTQDSRTATDDLGTPPSRSLVRSSAAASQIFLDLAATVGQAVPARRLIEYKLRFEAASQPRYWAVVDFNQPSTSKRLYIFDTLEKKVETYYVAHGRGSEGAADDGIAEVFSNQDGSFSSSLGIYRTLDEYNGHHGRSLRLEGLESTNSNALARAVVLHTADYVSETFIRQTGRLGRSEGCLAVEKSVGDTLINELKNGAYIIAWKS